MFVAFVRAVRWIGLAAFLMSFGVMCMTLLAQLPAGPLPGQSLLPSAALRRSLIDTIWMASTAVVASIALALPAAAGMALVRHRARSLILALTVFPVVIMPSVHAYALLILSTSPIPAVASVMNAMGFNDTSLAPFHAGVLLACWLWPIPAVITAAAFRHAGAGVYRLASLDAPPLRAFIRGALPAMGGPIVAAAVVVFILTAIDSTVAPFVAASRVWGVELMTDAVEATGTERPAAYVFYRAWPLVLIVVALAAVAAPSVRNMLNWSDPPDHGETGINPAARRLLCVALIAMVAAIAAAPILVYAISMFDGRYTITEAFAQAWRSGSRPMATTLFVAALTSALSMTLAVALLRRRGASRLACALRGAALTAVAAAALMPPPMIGTTFVTFFSSEWVSPADRWNVYDHTPIAWIASMLCRYAFIPVFVLEVMSRRIPEELPAQAAIDGASPIQSLARASLPLLGRPLIGAAVLVAGLSFTDIAASSLVQPPQWGGGSIAVWTDSQMHYGRHNHTTALALMMFAPALLVAGVIAASSTRTRRAA